MEVETIEPVPGYKCIPPLIPEDVITWNRDQIERRIKSTEFSLRLVKEKQRFITRIIEEELFRNEYLQFLIHLIDQDSKDWILLNLRLQQLNASGRR